MYSSSAGLDDVAGQDTKIQETPNSLFRCPIEHLNRLFGVSCCFVAWSATSYFNRKFLDLSLPSLNLVRTIVPNRVLSQTSKQNGKQYRRWWEPSLQDLHCFQTKLFWSAELKKVNHFQKIGSVRPDETTRTSIQFHRWRVHFRHSGVKEVSISTPQARI